MKTDTFEAPRTPERNHFLRLDDKLKQAAILANQAIKDLQAELEAVGAAPVIAVQYPDAKRAAGALTALKSWRAQQPKVQAGPPPLPTPEKAASKPAHPVPPAGDPAEGDLRHAGQYLQLKAAYWPMNDHTLNQLLNNIGNAASEPWLTIPADTLRLLKSLAGAFKHGPKYIVTFEADISSADMERAGKAAVVAFDETVGCLQTLIARCHRDRPRDLLPKITDPHVIHISASGSVTIDGDDKLSINEARRAAIYTLAILGTANVNTEQFAILYRPGCVRKSPCKPDNIFNQAMRALQELLPQLQWTLADRAHRRNVLGLTIICASSASHLDQWLENRGAGADASQLWAKEPPTVNMEAATRFLRSKGKCS